MSKLELRKAARTKVHLKVALTGPSGSGKTMGALKLAIGMGAKKIGVIDTENRSSEYYADQFDFLVVPLDPPFTVQRYVEAMKLILAEKCDFLIIDSITHAWQGEGGLLQQKEDIDSRGGKGERNKFANWGPITKDHELFKSWILHSKIHTICTMRSKTKYEIGAGNKPEKIGLEPIQREGMDYEFGLVLDIARDHSAAASKDRTGLWSEKRIELLSEAHGKELLDWATSGKGELAPVSVPAGPAPTPPAPPDPLAVKRKNVEEIAKAQGYTGPETLALARQLFEKPKLKWLELTDMNLNLLQTYLKTNKKAPPLGSDEDIQAAAMEAGEIPQEEPPAVEQYDGAAYESVDNLAGGVP